MLLNNDFNITFSVKYQLSVHEFNRLISLEQSTASTQTHIKRFILGALFHIPYYMRITYSDLLREKIEIQY